jgi:hypothetical protein
MLDMQASQRCKNGKKCQVRPVYATKPTKEIQNTLAKTTTILKVDIQGNLYERRE